MRDFFGARRVAHGAAVHGRTAVLESALLLAAISGCSEKTEVMHSPLAAQIADGGATAAPTGGAPVALASAGTSAAASGRSSVAGRPSGLPAMASAGHGMTLPSVGGSGASAGMPASGGGMNALIAGTGAAGVAGGSAAAGGSAGMASPTREKFVGNITTRGAVQDGFAKYWNQITPENEGKWGSVQPTQDSFNWTALDKIYGYAKSNNIIFKQHNFVWGSQQPAWVNDGNAEVSVKAWMKAFCERYPEVKLIDVVNEPPPHTTPNYIGGMGGAGQSGYDWIVNAFKWARESCPNAILILNDYNNIEYANDNAHTIDIVTKIKAAGAPIDAVGAQAHDAAKLSTASVKAFIDKIATSTQLPVYITEYDIGIADDNQQKMVMQDQITMYWKDENVKGITIWGYIVGATWRANTGLQQSSGEMRPAMTWLMDFLQHP